MSVGVYVGVGVGVSADAVRACGGYDRASSSRNPWRHDG